MAWAACLCGVGQVWRPQAKVSVLDSCFMLGDGVWEGIRLHKGARARLVCTMGARAPGRVCVSHGQRRSSQADAACHARAHCGSHPAALCFVNTCTASAQEQMGSMPNH